MSAYIPTSPQEQQAMLKAIGVEHISDLFSDIDSKLQLKKHLDLPKSLSEYELVHHMQALSEQNTNLDRVVSFLGAGAYDHIIPAVIKHIISRGEFLTAYTPYQAEISQGVLQAIFEFQSLMANLTKMEVANASMYDGATALAEAALLACNVTRRDKVAIPANLHPEWQSVVKTYLAGQNVEIITIAYDQQTGAIDTNSLEQHNAKEFACMVVAQPNFFGGIESVQQISDWIKSQGGLLIMAVDPLSIGVLKAPGDYGADIAVGDGGCLGNAISFGGPSVGFFAVSGNKLVRKMPGRLVGETIDRKGRRGYVLTLQTREQHIRREKATSNICTNQALNALATTIYLALLGKEGIKNVANQSLQKATYLKQALITSGFKLRFSSPTFKEFVVQADLDWQACNDKLLEQGYLAGLHLKDIDPNLSDCQLIAVTEARTKEQMDQFAALLGRCHNA